MEFQFITLLPSSWVHALGLTLFHSLWVGTILALLTGLIIITTKKSTALTRYNLLIAMLSLFVVVMGVIFYTSLADSGVSSGANLKNTSGATLPAVKSELQGTTDSFVLNRVTSFLDLWSSYSAQIVLIWFSIICIKGIQLMVGLHTVYYLKNTKIFSAGEFWENKVKELSEKLVIKKSIKILQSGIAKVPMVAGHFMPVILLPLGMLNGLTLTEVEAILSHELAHVKRRDYLVNMLQSLIEIVFFFNPAVLWISRLVKEERENCCDDLALSCTSDKKEYIKALISCQEFQMNVPEYAMAITGKRGQLLERVSRMVFNTGSSLNRIEKTMMTVALISVLVCTAAFTNIANYINPVQEKYETSKLVQDTLKRKRLQMIKKEVVVFNNENGKEVPAPPIPLGPPISPSPSPYQMTLIAPEPKVSVFAGPLEPIALVAPAEPVALVTPVEPVTPVVPVTPVAPIKIKVPITPAEPKMPIIPATPKTPVTPVVPKTPLTPVIIKIPADQLSGKRKTSTNKTSRVTITTDRDGDMTDETESINQKLLNDRIISQTKRLNYQLNEYELIVNGVRQPDNLHKKYRLRYLKGSNSSVSYSNQEL
ncbi:M48 family metalloprotease [Pedobacter sp. PAMC26386]|nr:M48 family metalloprotease [Pedobacter sp. PAMC26386]